MKTVEVIAIDGPAGSGKSTIAKNVAEKLGFIYIDTGAMYRALTLKAMEYNVWLNDKKALVALAENTDINLESSGGSLKVILDGKDVSLKIRSMEVTSNVRHVASVEGVRTNMVNLQRKLASSGRGFILEGRDIGTVVFPDAHYKFYLDATLDTRVERRFKELKEKDLYAAREEVKEDLIERDKSDMTRAIGPLKKAKDAVVIDTTGMTIDEVTEKVFGIVRN